MVQTEETKEFAVAAFLLGFQPIVVTLVVRVRIVRRLAHRQSLPVGTASVE
jgi:hypothetical protein